MPTQRGASLTTNEHIDPASPPAQLAMEQDDPDKMDIPEGAVPFNLTPEEIAAAIAEDSLEVGCLHSPGLPIVSSAPPKSFAAAGWYAWGSVKPPVAVRPRDKQ